MEEQRLAGQIPASHLDLFCKRALGHLATLMPDGRPHVTPVWIDYDGTCLLVNTARGRRKELNVRQRPWVALDITDPDNLSRRLIIQGKVIEATTDNAEEHLVRLSQRYLGLETYPSRVPDEVRVILKIQPEQVLFK